MNRIVLIGAAGQASVAAEAIEHEGRFEILGLVSRDPADRGWTYPLLGDDEALPSLWQRYGNFACHAAVGDPAARRRIVDALARLLPAASFPAIVHPLARRARHTEVGDGSFVAIGATLCTGARVGRNVLINTNASVDHDCIIEDYASIAPNVALGGTVQVGSGAFIGIGASVLPNLRIGERAVVGAGAVVREHVPAGAMVVGVPARRRI